MLIRHKCRAEMAVGWRPGIDSRCVRPAMPHLTGIASLSQQPNSC